MIRNCSYKFIVLTFLFIVAFTSLRAQRLDSLLNILDENYPQEKIHLHLDKAFYNPGETIWFKVYLVTDNLPTTLSKTCYADLIDEKGTLLQRKMMPVLESGAASNFELPDTLHASKLFIRAYTSWMLNFDSSLLTVLPIRIIPVKPLPKKVEIAPVYTLTLFPEGGDLVQDINSIVAFKATDQEGVPFNLSGNIVDDKGKQIAPFKSVHDGMGYFPLQQKKVRIKVLFIWNFDGDFLIIIIESQKKKIGFKST